MTMSQPINNIWHKNYELPMTLLLDYEEYIGEVGTRQYVEKATDYFSNFYGSHIEGDSYQARMDLYQFKNQIQEKVIEQIKCIITGKDMEQGLDAIGVRMSKDILFPQILEAHQRSPKKIDMVELYLYIHKRR